MFSPDDEYIVISGQHISAALSHVRQQYLLQQNQPGDDYVPTFLRGVSAIILQENTPMQALINAAGFHQSTQRHTTGIMVTDFMRALVRHRQLQQCTCGTISDEDILPILVFVGLTRQSELTGEHGLEYFEHSPGHLDELLYLWRPVAYFSIANTGHIHRLIEAMSAIEESTQMVTSQQVITSISKTTLNWARG